MISLDRWVPVVRVGGKVTIFPGIPKLFERLVTGYASRFIQLPDSSEKPFRVLVHTAMPESSLAPFLTKLHERVRKEGIRVGSYPKLLKGVDVSLIGKDESRLLELAEEGTSEIQSTSATLYSLGTSNPVVKELDGELVARGKLGEEEDVKK